MHSNEAKIIIIINKKMEWLMFEALIITNSYNSMQRTRFSCVV